LHVAFFGPSARTQIKVEIETKNRIQIINITFPLEICKSHCWPLVMEKVKIEEEKVKHKLRGRHSDCHWVEVRKREKTMEQSTEKKVDE